MFTGIIAERGIIRATESFGNGRRLVVEAHTVLADAALGDSISINGVCLTVTAFTASSFSVEAVEHTISHTTLGGLQAGDRVNLEAALRADGKLGGHFVQGHADRIARIVQIREKAESWLIEIEYDPADAALLVPQGSIAIDGVSLTIAELGIGSFTVSVIPHTYYATVFEDSRPGRLVNIEFDVLGKYVLAALANRGDAAAPGRITPDFLGGLGY